MFERFTDRARRVLVLAQEEARLLNHSFIGTEHILLGLIHEGEGLAAMALEALGISLEAVREIVQGTIGPVGSGPPGSPPFTPRAKKVLELSLREALQLGHNYIGTEHMLLGLVREGEGVAAQVLESLGADLARVRQQVIQLLSGYQGQESVHTPGGPTEELVPGDFGLVGPFRPIEGAPYCARCGSPLEGNLRYREVLAEAEGSTQTERVRIHYCVRCGNALEGSSMSGISGMSRRVRPGMGHPPEDLLVADPKDETSLEG